MAGGVEMLGRVLIGRLVAATDMAAGAADAEVKPAVAGLQAILAAVRAGCDVVNVVEMRAGRRHA